MSFVYYCNKVLIPEWVDGPGVYDCPHCGCRHEAYEAGPPAPEPGMPNIVSDKIPKHHDWAAGCDISSRSQRKRVYKQKGLRRMSLAEYNRKYGHEGNRGVAYAYAGQKNHKSTSEKYQNQ